MIIKLLLERFMVRQTVYSPMDSEEIYSFMSKWFYMLPYSYSRTSSSLKEDVFLSRIKGQ